MAGSRDAPITSDVTTAMKRRAAAGAVALVESGMTVGLGSGSTAAIAIELLAARRLDVVCVACTREGAELAIRLGMRLVELSGMVDLTIDGADEVDARCDLIKGGGGALLHEKILAQASRRLVIAVDASKRSPRLGTRFRLPVEVFPYGWRRARDMLVDAGLAPGVRGDPPFVTDEGNHILDCAIGDRDVRELSAWLDGCAAIAGHGLFLGMTTDVFVGGADGVTRIVPPAPEVEAHRAFSPDG